MSKETYKAKKWTLEALQEELVSRGIAESEAEAMDIEEIKAKLIELDEASGDDGDDEARDPGNMPASQTATGRFVVSDVEGGKRLFNELGQAVSPVCALGSDELAVINRQAERANALLDSRRKLGK